MYSNIFTCMNDTIGFAINLPITSAIFRHRKPIFPFTPHVNFLCQGVWNHCMHKPPNTITTVHPTSSQHKFNSWVYLKNCLITEKMIFTTTTKNERCVFIWCHVARRNNCSLPFCLKDRNSTTSTMQCIAPCTFLNQQNQSWFYNMENIKTYPLTL